MASSGGPKSARDQNQIRDYYACLGRLRGDLAVFGLLPDYLRRRQSSKDAKGTGKRK